MRQTEEICCWKEIVLSRDQIFIFYIFYFTFLCFCFLYLIIFGYIRVKHNSIKSQVKVSSQFPCLRGLGENEVEWTRKAEVSSWALAVGKPRNARLYSYSRLKNEGTFHSPGLPPGKLLMFALTGSWPCIPLPVWHAPTGRWHFRERNSLMHKNLPVLKTVLTLYNIMDPKTVNALRQP